MCLQVPLVKNGEPFALGPDAIVGESAKPLSCGAPCSEVVQADHVHRFENEDNVSGQLLEQSTDFLKIALVIVDKEIFLFFLALGSERLRRVNRPVSKEDGEVPVVFVDAHFIAQLLNRGIVHRDEGVPELAKLFAEGLGHGPIEAVIKEHDLGSLWVFGVRSHQDVAWVGVTVHMAMQENHLGEDLYQHIRAHLGATKLFVQSLNIIDLRSFDVLHQDGALGAFKDINLRDVQVIVFIARSEVILCLLCVDYLGLKVQLLQKTFLEMIEELVEVDPFVIVALAKEVCQLRQPADHKQVQLGLHA